METTISRTKSGWRATTELPFDDNRVLDLTTARIGGQLKARAAVMTVNGAFRTTVFFRDYSAVVVDSDKSATEKNVKALHTLALGNIEEVLTEARAFYAAKEGQV